MTIGDAIAVIGGFVVAGLILLFTFGAWAVGVATILGWVLP